jgi:hypothetical protein
MPKQFGAVVVVVAVLTSQVGCHTTKVISRGRPTGPVYTSRQWFTAGGLVPLSGTPGIECEDGLSSVESRLGATDWFINAGLFAAGAVLGGVVCGNAYKGGDPLLSTALPTACGIGFSQIVPFFLSSRTVDYGCAEGTGQMDYMPPRQGGYLPEQPAPEGIGRMDSAPAPVGVPPPAPAPAPAPAPPPPETTVAPPAEVTPKAEPATRPPPKRVKTPRAKR